MKLLTWNIESPAITANKKAAIIKKLEELDADIIIVTETNEAIELAEEYHVYHTPYLKSIAFGVKTNRTTIYSKYPSLRNLKVNDADTCVCHAFETPLGKLCVYGTIIGNLGGKGGQFKIPFAQQLVEYKEIIKEYPLCIAGDLNINFTGYAYPSKEAIITMQDFCLKNDLVNLTAGIENCVDHIILSKSFIGNRDTQIQSWNHDLKLSDHIGVMVEVV